MSNWDKEFQEVLLDTLAKEGSKYTTNRIPSTAKETVKDVGWAEYIEELKQQGSTPIFTGSKETPAIEKENSSNIEVALFSGVTGFLLGVLVAFAFFRIKAKAIKKEYEARISEARASLDRLLLLASQKEQKEQL